MIKLFEIQGKVVKPTEHCEMISWLKTIKVNFPDNHLKVYGYIFYMCCPSKENPYCNLADSIKEDVIIKDLGIDFSLDADCIIEALQKAILLYETPTLRSYNSIKTMLDNLSDYMRDTAVTSGRDGNINSLLRVAEKYDAIRKSFKGVAKDLDDEQNFRARGGQELGYDQIN